MGTRDPLVRIEAATLAGGDNNQDRYAYGDGWAFVLDGASSFSETPPVHDGGWYADKLRAALVAQLVDTPQIATLELVATAIREASTDHNSTTQGSCPASTIALARWDADVVELYALGDSVAALIAPNDEVSTLLNDVRIERVGRKMRDAYRRRLADGHGFDFGHRQLLRQLQDSQGNARNRDGGFWIASDDPAAAGHGYLQCVVQAEMRLVLFSDGLTTIQTPERACSALVEGEDLSTCLALVALREAADPNGTQFPRSKLHDDKTVVLADFRPVARETCGESGCSVEGSR